MILEGTKVAPDEAGSRRLGQRRRGWLGNHCIAGLLWRAGVQFAIDHHGRSRRTTTRAKGAGGEWNTSCADGEEVSLPLLQILDLDPMLSRDAAFQALIELLLRACPATACWAMSTNEAKRHTKSQV